MSRQAHITKKQTPDLKTCPSSIVSEASIILEKTSEDEKKRIVVNHCKKQCDKNVHHNNN